MLSNENWLRVYITALFVTIGLGHASSIHMLLKQSQHHLCCPNNEGASHDVI